MPEPLPWSRARWVLLALVIAILLSPIWFFRYLPLVDYPDHLARAYILAHLDDPAYAGFYRAAWGPYPYLAGDLLLVALQKIVPIDIAGRILLSLCVLSVPAASWFFLRRANPENAILAAWSLPLSYNVFFLSGFMNMQLSMALCLVVIALWLGWLQQPRSGWLGLLLLVNGLYFTHLMGFAVAGVVVGVYSLLVASARREIPRSWAMFVPGALLYLYASAHAGLKLQSAGLVLSERFRSPLIALRTHYLALDVIGVVVVVACVIAALFSNREFRWNRPWLEVSFALYLVSVFLPSGGLTIINGRIMPF
ncbi:MAG: hypothetical protein ACREB3_07585, partial [Burkholderiales bacterium]